MKGTRLLFGIVVVLLLVTSVLPGCNKEQQLVIPSSLTPVEVFKEVAITDSYSEILPLLDGEWTAEYMEYWDMPQGATVERFIEGYGAVVPEVTYTMSDGKRAGCGYDRFVLHIVILKYEDTESAERSFINIGKTQQLQNLTYEGIALKNGTCFIPDWEGVEEYYWSERNQPCYLIHSGCFVIHYYGREDVLNDMLDRIIATFGVRE
ncbi:hypothetical protein ES706_03361 [subsurface metagenome]